MLQMNRVFECNVVRALASPVLELREVPLDTTTRAVKCSSLEASVCFLRHHEPLLLHQHVHHLSRCDAFAVHPFGPHKVARGDVNFGCVRIHVAFLLLLPFLESAR